MCSVSVIIPVFNAEATLDDCISCLNAQILQSIEFIFVNDGSIDASSDILEIWKMRNPKIHVIHQENQGVSVARNEGILHAKGQYIGFVDADDRIPPNYFETVYNLALKFNTDCVITRFKGTQNGVPYESEHPFSTQVVFDNDAIKMKILPYFIAKDDLNPVWNKLYKKAVIDSNKEIQFPPKMVFGEDGVFNMLYLKHAQSVVFDSYCGYHYVEMNFSATRNVGNKDFLAIAKAQLNFDFERIFTLPITPKQVQQLQQQRFAQAVLAMINLYLNATLKKSERISKVRLIINDPVVQEVIAQLPKSWLQQKSRFERLIVKGIQLKSVFLLRLLTEYSNFRNQ